MIIFNAIKCLMCGDTIFSRSRHDFKSCYCGNLSVDGGSFYHDDSGMVGGEKYGRKLVYVTNTTKINTIEIDLDGIDINNVKQLLYEDWNNGENKYGLYRDYHYTDEQRILAKAKINLLK